MTLPDADPPHKQQPNQESPLVRRTDASVKGDEYYPHGEPTRGYFLVYRDFVRAWASVLHPLSYTVFFVLHSFADTRDGATLGHTLQRCTRARLRDLTGTNDHGLTRALRELVAWRLIEFSERDPDQRARNGKRFDVLMRQPAAAPPGSKRVPFGEFGPRGRDLVAEAIAKHAPEGSETGTLTPRQIGVPPPAKMAEGTPRQIGVPQRGIVVRNTLETTARSSSSSHPGKKATTTTQRKNGEEPNLKPLADAIPLIVDDAALSALWNDATAAQPSITVRELAQVATLKWKMVCQKKPRDPLGYLLTAVKNAIKGDGLTQLREWLADYRKRNRREYDGQGGDA